VSLLTSSPSTGEERGEGALIFSHLSNAKKRTHHGGAEGQSKEFLTKKYFGLSELRVSAVKS
jgi:hypothetical protein